MLKYAQFVQSYHPFQLQKRQLTLIPFILRFREFGLNALLTTSILSASGFRVKLIKRKKEIFIPLERQIGYISFKQVCQLCYRKKKYKQKNIRKKYKVEIVKSEWFSSHKADSTLSNYKTIQVCIVHGFFSSSQKTHRFIYSQEP